MNGEWLSALYLSMILPMVLLSGHTGDAEAAGETEAGSVSHMALPEAEDTVR